MDARKTLTMQDARAIMEKYNKYDTSPLVRSSTVKAFCGEDFSQFQAIHRIKGFKASLPMQLGTCVHDGIEHINRGPELNYSSFSEILTQAKTKPTKEKYIAQAQSIVQAFKNQAPDLAEMVADNPKGSELEVYGKNLKAKYDHFNTEGIIYDWKTMGKEPTRKNIFYSLRDFNYPAQVHHYMEAGREAGLDVKGFVFVFIQSSEPYEVVRVPVDPVMMEQGRSDWILGWSRYNRYAAGDIESGRTVHINAQPTPEVEELF